MNLSYWYHIFYSVANANFFDRNRYTLSPQIDKTPDVCLLKEKADVY